MPQMGKIHRDRNQTSDAKGKEERRMKSDCLMDSGFYFGIMEMFQNRIDFCNTVNVLYATKLYTLKWLILLWEFHFNKKMMMEPIHHLHAKLLGLPWYCSWVLLIRWDGIFTQFYWSYAIWNCKKRQFVIWTNICSLMHIYICAFLLCGLCVVRRWWWNEGVIRLETKMHVPNYLWVASFPEGLPSSVPTGSQTYFFLLLDVAYVPGSGLWDWLQSMWLRKWGGGLTCPVEDGDWPIWWEQANLPPGKPAKTCGDSPF